MHKLDEKALAAALRTEWLRFLDCNPDDLTSPEDLPDHALMTCDQFVEYALASLSPEQSAAQQPATEAVAWRRTMMTKWGPPSCAELTEDAELAEMWRHHPSTVEVVPLYAAASPLPQTEDEALANYDTFAEQQAKTHNAFFTGRAMECASYGCEKPATVHVIAGSIGSYYCDECRSRIAALSQSPSKPAGGSTDAGQQLRNVNDTLSAFDVARDHFSATEERPAAEEKRP